MEETLPTLDKIPVVEKTAGIDVSNYEGKRVRIAKATPIWAINYYPDGENFKADSTEKVLKLELETEPLKELDANGNFTEKDLTYEKDGVKKTITVNTRLSFQPEVKDGKTNWVVSKHPKAKLWAFMRKLGATIPQELIGKIITLTVEPSKKPGDDKKYLRFVL
jgi:hypothetical protein